MKKSIFLIFAAILCAMSANAKVVYLKLNDKWSASEARYYVHVWGGSSSNTSIEMQAVEGETNMYKIEVGTHNSIIFLRHKTTTTVTESNKWNNLLNRLGNLAIPETANCCTIKNGVTTVENGNDDEAASSVTWSTYTPAEPEPEPEPVETHDITVKAKYPAAWNAGKAAIHFWGTGVTGATPAAMTKDGDWWSYTVTGVPTTSELSVIFINGDNWNGDANQTFDITGIKESSCYQVTAASGKATAAKVDCETGEAEVVETHDITIKAFYPAAWNAGKAAIHFWGDGVTGATPAAMTKDGDWWSYTITGVPTTSKLSVIFINGDNWNGDANQTVDITGIEESACYQITSGSGKANATAIDCESTPVVAEDVYTVVGSENLFGSAWAPSAEANDMEKQDDGSYKKVYSNVELTSDVTWKIAINDNWWNGPSFNNQDNTLAIAKSGIYNVTFVLSADLKTATAEAELLEETNTVADCFISGNAALTGGEGWKGNEFKMEDYDSATKTYSYTLTGLVTDKAYELKVVLGGVWHGFAELVDPAPANVSEGTDNSIAFKMATAGDVVVTYNKDNGINLTGNFAAPVTYDYYIAGTLAGGWSATQQGMEKDGELYKATFNNLAAGTYEFKITDGQFNTEEDKTHEHTALGAEYEEVGYNEGNIKIDTDEAINLTVIFNAATDQITFENLTEKAPAEPVTVYFINSGNWDEVACHYWGGLNGSAWPGKKMTANGEVYEAEGWNVYAITFPGDNTSCIFNDNKAEGATQTGNLEVHDGQYYCYANGIWYERLADVDLLDTRVYLKGDMNEWCANYCDMFRKETVDGTVVYRTVYLEEANTTYEFKIESAGAWLSNIGTMTKDNCTGWTFEESVYDNAKITTEYAGDYIFTWDMTTNKLSVEYPELVPTVMDLVVTDMVFDGATTFNGSDNEYGIVFNLVVGDPIEEGVFALDASSTVDFGGMPFTDVTGTIAPDMNTFASATAVVKGFLGGSEYFQFNLDMSAGGGTPVEIWDGVATPNDGTGELTISATWDGDDVYVVVPGFNYTNYECPEVWFYVGGTTWETASIAAYGPATITVEDGGVLVEGTVMSGVTGTSYALMVFGLLPVEETPDYTRTVALNQWGTICLPNASSSFTGATFYEVSSLDPAKGLWLDQLEDGAQLVAGKPYIFYATATEIAVTYTGDAEEDPVEGANGLTGTFTGIAAGDLTGNYIIAENKVWVAGASATLPANRAYIANTVPTTEQPQLPGRRRVCMGENATTGLDQIVAPAGQAVKAIENGQLIIIRDGVKYNVQGQKL